MVGALFRFSQTLSADDWLSSGIRQLAVLMG
jgi:hypothetical protein